MVGDAERVVFNPGSGEVKVDHLGRERYTSGCASVVHLEGTLFATVTIRAGSTKNGVPSCWLALDEIVGRTRRWLDFELPMYAPRLSREGTTLVASDTRRTIAFDLGEALAWYREQWTGRDDAPGLPPKAQKTKKPSKKQASKKPSNKPAK